MGDRIDAFLNNDRLLTNLLGIHGLLALILIASFAARMVLLHGGDRILRLLGLSNFRRFTEEAARSVRSLVFWVTLLAMVSAVGLGLTYHGMGRDLRADVSDLYQQTTAEQLRQWSWTFGNVLLIAIGALFGLRLARGLLHRLEKVLVPWIEQYSPPQPSSDANESLEEGVPPPLTQRQTLHRWFLLLNRCLTMATLVIALSMMADAMHWTAGHRFLRFVSRILILFFGARLATLAFRTVLQVIAFQGNNNIARDSFRRYWERVTRLFPFAQRCFEAAVYVSAFSLIIGMLSDMKLFNLYGRNLVECIGIFFGTRVLIELLQVLLNEAFGMYDEMRPIDQKGLTLVPLLQSLIQYAFYFGCLIMILQTLGLPTTPILAGASILGLAGGLGAQSLVTDVVSGFFILFENQYLVGDIVAIGDAQGRVEAVSIRSTQIRDDQGRLNIIPNGQIKNVVNYSKGFVNAVVDIKFPITMNVDQIMRDMMEAGKKLKQARREVMGDTIVKGLLDLTPSDMVLRAVTKVQPGTHGLMQNEYRRILKEIFDQRTSAKAAA